MRPEMLPQLRWQSVSGKWEEAREGTSSAVSADVAPWRFIRSAFFHAGRKSELWYLQTFLQRVFCIDNRVNDCELSEEIEAKNGIANKPHT